MAKYTLSLATVTPSSSSIDMDKQEQEFLEEGKSQEFLVKSDDMAVREKLNLYFELKEKSLRQQYHLYYIHHIQGSSEYLIFLTSVFLIALFPVSLMNFVSDLDVKEIPSRFAFRVTVSTFGVLSSISTFLLGYLLLIHFQWHQKSDSNTKNTNHSQLTYIFIQKIVKSIPNIYIPLLHGLLITTTELYFIAVFFRRSYNLNCVGINSLVKDLFVGGRCFKEEEMGHIITGNSFLMFLFPVLMFACLPGTPICFIWYNLLMAIIVHVSTILYLQAPSGAIQVLLWIIAAYFAIRNIQFRNVSSFFLNLKLQEMMVAKERAQEEYHANEMRSLIANVAHDLKTVSSLIWYSFANH